MRSMSWLSLGLVGLGVLLGTACATSVRPGVDLAEDPNDPAGDGDASSTPGSNDEGTSVPHSLGRLTLGETRASTTGDSTPIISASFYPDAKLAKACTKNVGTCEITQIPKCTTGTTTGCPSGELCAFDDGCTAKCVKACTRACQASEECVFNGPTTGPDGGMTCRKKDRFDGGAISFSGTTTAITLFPPYAITPEGNGAPFMARSEIRVQSTGAIKAGFEKFDDKFLATTFLETNPPLTDIPRTEIFGSSDLAIGWVPGEDKVFVGVTGPAGSAKCGADDKSGRYSLPRDVIREVLTSDGGTPTLSLSVTRERREIKKDKKAFGSLAGQSVQPVGWLELITSSSETHSYTSCSPSLTMCGDQCVSTLNDAKHCGGCNRPCPTGSYCSSGTCSL